MAAALPIAVSGCFGPHVPPRFFVCEKLKSVPIRIGDPRSVGEFYEKSRTNQHPQDVGHHYEVHPTSFYLDKSGRPFIVGVVRKPERREYGESLFSNPPIVCEAGHVIYQLTSDVVVPEGAEADRVVLLFRAANEDLGWRMLRPTVADLRDGIEIADLASLPKAEADPVGKACLEIMVRAELDH